MFVLDVLAPTCVRNGLLGIQKQTKARAYHCTGVKVTRTRWFNDYPLETIPTPRPRAAATCYAIACNMKRLPFWVCTNSFPLPLWIPAALCPLWDSQLPQIWIFATPCWPLDNRDHSAFWDYSKLAESSRPEIYPNMASTIDNTTSFESDALCLSIRPACPWNDYDRRTGPCRYRNWNSTHPLWFGPE